MNREMIAVAIASLALAGCMDFKQAKSGSSTQGQLDGPPAMLASQIAFADVQKYILTPSCVRCHSGTKPAGNIDFTNYATTVASAEVVNPGSAQGSSLYTEIATGDMPDGGAQLTSPYVSLVYDWIQAGAVESPESAPGPTASPTPIATPSPVPSPVASPAPLPSPLPPAAYPVFADIQKSVLIPSCIKCHGGSHPDGKVNLSSYAAIIAQPKVLNPGSPQGSALYTEIATGSMPKRAAHLNATLVNSVYEWIKAGAPEKAAAQE
jgi:hypothetical protein